MKKLRVLYFNCMRDSAYGESFKNGILSAARSHTKSVDIEVIVENCFYGESLTSPQHLPRLIKMHAADAVILSGSEKNTTLPEDPWVQEYLEMLRTLIPEDTGNITPIFGICFGHQALACALGGETARFRSAIGFRDVQLTHLAKYHPTVKPFADFAKDSQISELAPLKLAVLHGDQVVRMPKGFHLLAKSDYCDCQAMAHDRYPLMSVQGHPEITGDIRKIQDKDSSIWNGHSDAEYAEAHGEKLLHQVYDWFFKLTR